MMEKIIISIVIFFILISSIYLIFFGNVLCPIYTNFSFYCPGCGITRMLRSLINLEFYQAFRYNMLAFLLMISFIIYVVICLWKKKLIKIDKKILYLILLLVVLFTILRNIFPFFAPLVV